MRVIVTLFDFYESFPGPGTGNEAKNLDYLRALLPNFADDDRILAWDLHNEPDNYGIWKAGDPQKVLRWLGRMADEVHSLAPRQMVTVGMGRASSLWLPGPDGRRVIDYSDVVSMHTYDAGTVAQELDQLRAQTAKPIIIEEFGWPTGPAAWKTTARPPRCGCIGRCWMPPRTAHPAWWRGRCAITTPGRPTAGTPSRITLG